MFFLGRYLEPSLRTAETLRVSVTYVLTAAAETLRVKPGFHYSSWRPKLAGDWFPLAVNTGRVDGRAFPLAELMGRVDG